MRSTRSTPAPPQPLVGPTAGFVRLRGDPQTQIPRGEAAPVLDSSRAPEGVSMLPSVSAGDTSTDPDAIGRVRIPKNSRAFLPRPTIRPKRIQTGRLRVLGRKDTARRRVARTYHPRDLVVDIAKAPAHLQRHRGLNPKCAMGPARARKERAPRLKVWPQCPRPRLQ